MSTTRLLHRAPRPRSAGQRRTRPNPETGVQAAQESIRFEVAGPPRGKARPRVGQGHAFTPDATRQHEDAVAWAARRVMRGRGPLVGPVAVDLVAYHAVPASWPKWRKEQAQAGRSLPMGKPDVDNVCKLVLDALNGIAYQDDAAVVRLAVERRWAVGRPEGVAVTVSPAGLPSPADAPPDRP
ncbi:MAG TPA: RusA family crossover junction endodeoxyribonuclease [bacterium]|nr:RusA family crossover junction endodeoxyribonuclease [bacterium]